MPRQLLGYNLSMQCNIDQKGRTARFISGVVTIAAALIVTGLCYFGRLSPAFYWLAAVLVPLGAFQIFEARKGWCAMRAMGFKTPM